MFNRENIRVRPLSEELEGIGLDPERVMDDIERNAGLLEQHFGSPPTSEAFRGHLVEDVEVEPESDFDDDDTELDLDEEELDEDDDEMELGEAIRMKRKGYREDPETGKMVKVSIQQKRKEKAVRMRKKGTLRSAARAYRKRFKTKIARRRKRLGTKPAKKGFIRRMESTAAARLSQLREELETSSVNTGEVSPYEEAAINAGWLALLLGECFEAMGDVEAGEMLYAMSDSAAVLSENIEAQEGEMDEASESKLAALLEGVSKALATHEDLGAPSLFEAIEIGVENGLYEDEEEDDEDLIDEEDDDDEDFDLDDDDGMSEGVQKKKVEVRTYRGSKDIAGWDFDVLGMDDYSSPRAKRLYRALNASLHDEEYVLGVKGGKWGLFGMTVSGHDYAVEV